MLRKFGIEPGEGRIFAWSAACLMVLGWADVSVKNVAETLFVKRVGPEVLPLVFLISMALLVPTTWAVGRIATRTDRLRMLPITLAALGALLIPMWALVAMEFTSALGLLVIVSKQLASIALLVFFVSLGDLVDGRQAKRLLAPLMAGVTLGTLIGSFASAPLSRLIGIDGLLPFSSVALVVAALLALPLRRLRPAQLERAVRPGRPPRADERQGRMATFGSLWSESRFFRLLFVSVFCSGLLGPMLYVQFQFVADLATSGAGGEEKLMAFYSQFRGWISAGILLAQIGLTSRLYRVIGIPLAAAISPLLYLVGFFGLSVRLSLPVGVLAMSGTKLQDNAVYDPALRILYNLFPEDMRSKAAGLLEGPVKRGGGAVGNLINLAAIQLGGISWVGYLALPITLGWFLGALVLRRTYPALLLDVSARRRRGEDVDIADLLDAATLRALKPRLLDPNPERCHAAAEVVAEAHPERAVTAFAEAACSAPRASKAVLIAALDRILERSPGDSPANASAARSLATLLEEESSLHDRDRADVIQAYGRLTRGASSREVEAVLTGALADPSLAVRLAAGAALHRRGTPPRPMPDLDAALRDAAKGDDATARRTAREELRAELLVSDAEPRWDERLDVLSSLLERASDRPAAAEALADVAERHGERSAAAGEHLLPLRSDPNPRVRAAILRFMGSTGLTEQAPYLVQHLAYDESSDAERVRVAARDGLRALGPAAADALLVELSFGRRSTREAIVPLLRELKVAPEKLRELFEAELDSVQHRILNLHAIVRENGSSILVQHLGERLDEGLHAALLLLAAICGEDRIAELADPLRRARGGRQHAILLEALEAFLTPPQKARLVPLLEDQTLAVRSRTAAHALGLAVPSARSVHRALLEEGDELTRILVAASLSDQERRELAADGLAAAASLEDHDDVKPVECALVLKTIPLFEGLTTRQLMDLAGVVTEEACAPGQKIVREGEFSDCMYVIVEGIVDITRGDTHLNHLGPSEFFGEVAMLEGQTRTATVIARDEVKLLRLGRSNLLYLMEELPSIAISICVSLSRRVRDLTEKVPV